MKDTKVTIRANGGTWTVNGNDSKYTTISGNESVTYQDSKSGDVDVSGTFYNGNIKMYTLTPNVLTTTLYLTLTSDIDNFKSATDYELYFTGLTFDSASNIINTFIDNINDGKIKIDGYPMYPPQPDLLLENQFPFYVRPSKSNIDTLISTGTTNFAMVSRFNKKIKRCYR